jgi:hypothetical protein
VTTETMPAPPVEEELLEQLEAEFLRAPADFWSAAPQAGLSPDLPEPGTGWAVDDGPQMWMTQWRTRHGCCG